MRTFFVCTLLGFVLAAAQAGRVAAQDAAAPAPTAEAPTGISLAVDPPASSAPASAATEEPVEPATPVAQPPAAPSPPAAEPLRLLVIDAATYGLDRIAGQYLTDTLRATGAEIGYQVLTGAESVAAAQSIHMPYPPAPADLWRVTFAAHATRGVFGRIWSQNGQYGVEITVAAIDGGGPFFARELVPIQELRAAVARMLRTVLAPPGVSTAGMPSGAHDSLTQRPSYPIAANGNATPGTALDRAIDSARADQTPPPRRRTGKALRWEISLQTESALGVSGGFFYNHVLGARLDYRLTPAVRVGISLAYTNLAGSTGRVGNFLVMAQAENRVRVTPDWNLYIPLRIGIGYLPFNGPVVRTSAGVAWPLSRQWDLVIDLLAPTFWMVPGNVKISMDLSAEIGFKF